MRQHWRERWLPRLAVLNGDIEKRLTAFENRMTASLVAFKNNELPRLHDSARRLDGWALARWHQRGGWLRFRNWGEIVRALFVLGVTAVAAVLFAGAIAYKSYADQFVPPEEVGVNKPSGGATVLDRTGKVLFRYVDDDAGLRQPVALDQISSHLLAATIVTEDRSFYSNPGVNYSGLARALWENINPVAGEPLHGSGGSSITQQLVKNLYFSPEDRGKRSLDRKARETVFAFKLTERYSKEQILTWYLNQINYGGLLQGVESASKAYFGKPAKDLTLAEAALLAGIPQAPSRYDPRRLPDAAIERRNLVLDLVAEYEQVQIGSDRFYAVNKDEIESAKAAPLELAASDPFQLNAAHFVLTYLEPELEARFGKDALLEDGLVITTTLDLDLQREAERILRRWIDEYEAASNTHNGAAVILDPKTGEVLAMVGSRDYERDDIQGKNNNLLALNSPGSAFKPFVYLSLFLKFNAGPGNIIEDSPLTYRQPDGVLFSPRNPTNAYHGYVTIRNALGNSLNIPAFRAAQVTGVEEVVAMGRKVGITGLNGSYGPAIAIGGVDLKPFDLAYAYTVLANGGVMKGQKAVRPHSAGERQLDPVSVLEVKTNDGRLIFDSRAERTEQQVAPAEHVFLVNSILTDPNAQCLTFGCGALAFPGRMVAVKTGTSEPFATNGPNAGKIGETWAFGYTPDVVVGIWAGNADNSPITNILSTSLAFRAMRDILLSYYGDRPSTPFVPPEGIVRGRICHAQPVNMCVEDFFLRAAFDRLAEARPAPAPAAAAPPTTTAASPPADGPPPPTAPARQPQLAEDRPPPPAPGPPAPVAPARQPEPPVQTQRQVIVETLQRIEQQQNEQKKKDEQKKQHQQKRN